jgi:hypothetical protein
MRKRHPLKEHREAVILWLLAHKRLWIDPGLPLRKECVKALKADGLFSLKTAACDIKIEKYITDPRCARHIRL